MTRAEQSSQYPLPYLEVEPLVNFLVNGTTDAAELESLRRIFNETVSPQLKDLQVANKQIKFFDGERS